MDKTSTGFEVKKPEVLYASARSFENIVFTSGQLPIDPITGNIVADNFAEQARQSLSNIRNIVINEGSCLNNLLKINVLLTDMINFPVFNEVYKNFFDDNEYPARTAYQVVALPRNALVEIEAIFHK